MRVEEILDALNAEVLRKLCRNWREPGPTGTAKLHLNKYLCDIIRNRKKDFVHALNETERLFLSELAHTNAVPDTDSFRAKYGVASPIASVPGWSSREESISPLHCLVSSDRWSGAKSMCAETVAFRDLVDAPAKPKATSMPELPEQSDGRKVKTFSGEEAVFLELGRLLRLVQAGKIKTAGKSGRPTDASVRLITQALIGQDLDLAPPKEDRHYPYKEVPGPVRAHAWGVLVQQCGWAKARAGILKLTKEGTAVLASPTPQAFADGVSAFISDGDFDELNRVNFIRGQTGKAKRHMTDPGERREAAADAIAMLPVGEWITFPEAFRFAKANGAMLEVSGGGLLYICDSHYGHIYDDGDLARQSFRAVLMESFATLGLIDIAYVEPHGLWPEFSDCYGSEAHEYLGRYDGLLAIRPTPLGAFCLGASDTYEASPAREEPALQVLPNLDIPVLTQPDPGTLSMLELLAVQESDALWKLDAETILRTVESGTSWKALREMLSAASKQGLPANVEDWFSGLESKADRCKRASKAVLYEWRDEAEALTLANSTGTAPHCHHAGGNRLVVPHKNLTAFTRAARKSGYLLPAAS